jgi:hypothetical protein
MVRYFKSCARRRLAASLVATVGITATLRAANAQTEPAQATAPDSTYTLHVYADLLQVPTLVLTPLHGNYVGLTSENFTLSLDHGPAFHPTHVRREGNDSITLAILFDLTSNSESMFNSFAKAMSKLPAGLLSPRDYVSVYAYDCELVRTTEDKPATPDELRVSMQKVLTDGKEKARNGAPQSCWSEKRLYDVIATVAQDIGDSPGRRVILVISDGADRHSVNNNWSTVERYAGSKSITIFGIRPGSEHKEIGLYDPFSEPGAHGWWTITSADPFGMLCGSTGGVVLAGGKRENLMDGQIQRVITMLRNRYILEFPRPANGGPGLYSINVTISDPKAITRPAGVAFPPRERDPELPEGTLPQDVSKMPVVGSKPPDQPK